MALSGLAPMSEQNGGFVDRTAVWTVARTVAMSERCLPPGDHVRTGSAAMLNSRLRNCFHINVFGSSLGRCMKWAW